jgi:hypothetical protein
MLSIYFSQVAGQSFIFNDISMDHIPISSDEIPSQYSYMDRSVDARILIEKNKLSLAEQKLSII